VPGRGPESLDGILAGAVAERADDPAAGLRESDADGCRQSPAERTAGAGEETAGSANGEKVVQDRAE
jgi:hypothetical protein